MFAFGITSNPLHHSLKMPQFLRVSDIFLGSQTRVFRTNSQEQKNNEKNTDSNNPRNYMNELDSMTVVDAKETEANLGWQGCRRRLWRPGPRWLGPWAPMSPRPCPPPRSVVRRWQQQGPCCSLSLFYALLLLLGTFSDI